MMHRTCRSRLSEYLDGRLSGRSFSRVERHLGRCRACRSEFEQLRTTVSLLQSLPRPDAPEGFSARVMQRVRADRVEEAASQPFWRGLPERLRAAWLMPAAAAAFSLMVLVAVQGVQISVSLPGGQTRTLASAGFSEEAFVGPPLPRRTAPAPGAALSLASERRGAAEPGRARVGLGGAAGRVPALPPISGCHVRPGDPACAQWHAWMVDLALRDVPAFLVEMDAVPSGERERWVGELSRFAANAGASPQLAARLRAAGDPRATGWARRFERTLASGER